MPTRHRVHCVGGARQKIPQLCTQHALHHHARAGPEVVGTIAPLPVWADSQRGGDSLHARTMFCAVAAAGIGREMRQDRNEKELSLCRITDSSRVDGQASHQPDLAVELSHRLIERLQALYSAAREQRIW